MRDAFATDNVEPENGVSAVAVQAHRRISFFSVGDFALCELERLLSAAHYQEAVRIIQRQHPGEAVECDSEVS